MYELGIYRDDAEELIVELIAENFLNEERFARAFAGGKFRVKKWGRNKIEMALKQHDISAYCIKKGMEEIDENDYRQALSSILQKKSEAVREPNPFIRKNKIAQYVISRGYEPELVWNTLKEQFE